MNTNTEPCMKRQKGLGAITIEQNLQAEMDHYRLIPRVDMDSCPPFMVEGSDTWYSICETIHIYNLCQTITRPYECACFSYIYIQK